MRPRHAVQVHEVVLVHAGGSRGGEEEEVMAHGLEGAWITHGYH